MEHFDCIKNIELLIIFFEEYKTAKLGICTCNRMISSAINDKFDEW